MGQSFEELIKKSCLVYQKRGIALIHKIPTPWVVNYDKQRKKVIKAFPEEKSSVDFEGIWQGKSIAFEAKSTRERQRFDLKNVQDHQMEYLRMHQVQGGISFFLIEFSRLGEIYFVKYNYMERWKDAAKRGGRKSIPYDWFVQNCEIVMPGHTAVDFVKVLERMRKSEVQNKNK